MPKVEKHPTPETLRPLLEQAFREDVHSLFNMILAPKGFRLFDYFSEVLGKERSKEVMNLLTLANQEKSNARLTDEALAGVIRMEGFG